MTEYKAVKTIKLNLGAVISQYGDQFDWTASNGEEADSLFDSIEEAESDVRHRFE